MKSSYSPAANREGHVRAGVRPGRVISDERTRPDFPVYAETNDQVIQGQLAELQDYLRTKSSELSELGFENIQIAVEVSDDPAHAIVQLARHIRPTFIVMVRTAHPGIAERVFGTITQHVSREDVAPVMILPGHSQTVEQPG